MLRSVPTSARFKRAFTLVEALVAVGILTVLAFVIVPQCTNAASDTREATLKDVLRYLRTQLTVYRSEHELQAPGYRNGDPTGVPTPAMFQAQLTRYTDVHGVPADTQSGRYRFGPYVSEMPVNPINGQSGVWVVDGPTLPTPDPNRNCGWIYNARTMQIEPNLPGEDGEGVSYLSY